ncbi:hypothetical protein CDAR_263281 [Caerostris darwini]|uniref:Uncharacterized protein n=1 Tax=Caerostris darwini TaxID=1538125 RepID=A0AAV4RVI8_9ARAC|nr:hypothetical protein CDAR_263281 [Caerostris darwini]
MELLRFGAAFLPCRIRRILNVAKIEDPPCWSVNQTNYSLMSLVSTSLIRAPFLIRGRVHRRSFEMWSLAFSVSPSFQDLSSYPFFQSINDFINSSPLFFHFIIPRLSFRREPDFYPPKLL